MKHWIPIAICFVTGMFMLVQFFIPHPIFTSIYTTALRWVYVISVFATAIGIWTLIRLHYRRIIRRSQGWAYSIVVFVGFIATAVTGIIGGQRGKWFVWIFDNISVPLEATMFSLLAFFMASAAYRAFRARTLDATLLLVSAVLVMFGRVPISDLLYHKIFPDFLTERMPFLPEQLTEWIMSTPTMAARRGIMIGAALGAISTSLKVILGIERSYFTGAD